MFSERYIKASGKNKKTEKKIKKIEIDGITNKKSFFSFVKKQKENTKEERPKEDKLEKKEKSNKIAISIFVGTALLVFALKSFKEYRLEQAQEISAEEVAEFKNNPKKEELQNSDVKTDAPQESNVAKNTETTESKRELGQFLLAQKKDFALEDSGIKLSLSGNTIALGQPVTSNYILKKVEIYEDNASKELSDATISFDINKDENIVQTIQIKFKDSYDIDFYYEGVRITPKIAPLSRTDIIFSGNDLKPNLTFRSFRADNEFAYFNFEFYGKIFISKVSLNSLK